MILEILKKRWKLVFQEKPKLEGEECLGYCERPDQKGKRIVIDCNVTGTELLEVLIHEQTHAADWSKDEEWVEDYADDLDKNLVRIINNYPEKFYDGEGNFK